MSQDFPFISRIPGQATDEPNICGSSLAIAPGAAPVSTAAASGAETGQANVAGTVQPGSGRKNKVVVVGAGMAGLRAAAVLHRHGIEVVLLEGRDRIGGRVHTVKQDGGKGRSSTRDMGAAWMHETSQNPLVKLIRALNVTYYYDDGIPLHYTRHGRAGAQFKVKKVVEEYVDYAEWYFQTHPNAKDRSVDDFIQAFVDRHELISEDERLWAPQVIRDVEHMLGTTTAEASAKLMHYFALERNLYMKDGYEPIVQWFAQPLQGDSSVIQLNRIVKKIEWIENDGVKVQYQSDGKDNMDCVEGDAVIVTIPLGSLHHNLISFSPPLPDDIQDGLSKFGYGALGKVFFEFSDIFWSKDNDQFIYYATPAKLDDDDDDDDDDDAQLSTSSSGSSDGIEDPDNILNYPTTTVNMSLVADNTKELCVQIVEPLAQRIEAMRDDKSRIYKFFKPLFKLLRTEPYKTLPKVLNIEVTSWTQDPLAGFGTYSTEKVNDDPSVLYEALERHAGSKLQLSGEHCATAGSGCVHGAVASGETAAKNLLATFGVPYDGGDMVSLRFDAE